MSRDAAYWISKLKLERHVEGGSFRETYRSAINIHPDVISHKSYPDQHISFAPKIGSDQKATSSRLFNGERSASTAIYFLLEQGQFSAFHTIKSDEVWHFYDGDPLDIYEILETGELVTHKLGRDFEKGESLQAVVKAGNWFGSRVAAGGVFSLVGCTVAPGFDFADFTLAERAGLSEIYPTHAQLIRELTYS